MTAKSLGPGLVLREPKLPGEPGMAVEVPLMYAVEKLAKVYGESVVSETL